MLPLNRFAALSKYVTTQQVKVLKNLYGATCDHQYMLTAMPQLSKRMTITRRISDEAKALQMTALERLQNLRDGGGGICEEDCGGPLHLPRAPVRTKQKDVKKAPSRNIPGDGAQKRTNPEEKAPVLNAERGPKAEPSGRKIESLHGT